MLLFASTILLSAFLLFLVQPIIAKQILPWFGGSSAVWTTCLVFFQVLLLLGYAYSHLVTSRLPPKQHPDRQCQQSGFAHWFLPVRPPARSAAGPDPLHAFGPRFARALGETLRPVDQQLLEDQLRFPGAARLTPQPVDYV